MKKNTHFIIIAGEISGDMHGSRLLEAMKEQNPQVTFSGIGGDGMIANGLDARYHIRDMAFLGIGEVIRHLPFIKKVFHEIVALARDSKPAAVILIDYPGFNLRLAKAIKALGIPVIYYISPQLWAWGKKRVKKVRRYVDRMLVVFPFEVDFYQSHVIDAEYVGHPLVDRHYEKVAPKVSADGQPRTLGLLPGSRKQELEKLLPDMIATAELLHKQGKIAQAVIACVDNISDEFYRSKAGDRKYIRLTRGAPADFYNGLDAALVASGTATLETAYYRVPLVIVYRVNGLTWFLGNLLVKLDMIGLANIVIGKKLVPELLQDEFTAENAAAELSRLLETDHNRSTREQLQILREKLGQPGASANAARTILDFTGLGAE